MGLKPIALSFKNTREDMELYAWIINHSNMSGFIKDILRNEMNNAAANRMKVKNNNESLIELNQ